MCNKEGKSVDKRVVEGGLARRVSAERLRLSIKDVGVWVHEVTALLGEKGLPDIAQSVAPG